MLQHLFVYGTLGPDGPNRHITSEIGGSWLSASVRGRLQDSGWGAQIGYPVIFDITHTIRKYGIPSKDPEGGTREYLSVLSRAGVASGVDGIFIEAHPNPPDALCDAASQYYLDQLADFVRPLLDIHALVREHAARASSVG